MIILGLSCYYHDAAAALLVDGSLVAAAEEERFSRVKHDNGFPAHAIRFCLNRADIKCGDIDYVAFYEKPLLKIARSLKVLTATFPKSFGMARSVLGDLVGRQLGMRREISAKLGISPERIFFVEHHQSHAASSFFCSPFEDAAIVTIDGVGEWATATIGYGGPREPGSNLSHIKIDRELHFPHSLGMLYSAFTQFLGFQVNEGEYRVMGLAPYGKPRYLDKVDKVVSVAKDGCLRLNMEYFDFLASREYTYSSKFVQLFGPPNNDIEGKIASHYADIAASIQLKTEEILLAMAREAHRASGSQNLCLAGGVALNSVANGRISREGPFKRIFIQPAAGDSGGAVGAALFAEHQILTRPRKYIMEHAYLGQDYDDAMIANVLESSGIEFETAGDEDELASRTAELLASGQVIGWFQGRFEWGPRALGARSILADPRPAAMKDNINSKVKFREPFRPFAPAILEDRVNEYFDFDTSREEYPSRFMLTVHPFKPNKGDLVHAVNHAGTGRLQCVDSRYNPRYHRLIKSFGDQSGIPLILNTSFNLRGEPIVASPSHALSTFNNSGIDALVLGPHFVYKPGVKPARFRRRKPPKQWKASLNEMVPQMQEYQDLTFYPVPYLGYIQQPLWSSNAIHTDQYGFRFSEDDAGIVNSHNWPDRRRRGIFLGGSAAFGVGASADCNTIPSLLCRDTGISFINLGVRAGNSTQEFIAALPFVEQAENVLLYSGANTLLVWLQSLGRFDLFGPLFREEVLVHMAGMPLDFYRYIFNRGKISNAYKDELQRVRQHASLPPPPDPEAALQNALAMQTRDIRHLKRLCGENTGFSVVIQPFAFVAKDCLCNEEEYLFNLLFENTKAAYLLNKNRLMDLWPGYVRKLSGFCEDANIPVMDANALDYSGWCFIDPVHMTDRGYATVAKAIAEFMKC